MERLDGIGGVLFDLDGVFFVGNRPVAGGADCIAHLQRLGIPYRFVTNTTTQSRSSMALKLQAMGLPIRAEEIVSAPYAALLYLRRHAYRSCHLLLADEVKAEFAEFEAESLSPQAVVIGDIGPAWEYDLLNRVFRMLMDGAELIALHKGKFWQTEAGLQLDIGAFVAGLEYTTGRQATIIGKPSAAFFQSAVSQLALPPERVLMVGDDIDSDVGGAQQSGLKGVLVKTGKYRQGYADASPIKPDALIDSVADLLNLL